MSSRSGAARVTAGGIADLAADVWAVIVEAQPEGRQLMTSVWRFGYRDHMFRRKQVEVVQNDIVARRMRKFFRILTNEHRTEPETVAKIYGNMLWNGEKETLVD